MYVCMHARNIKKISTAHIQYVQFSLLFCAQALKCMYVCVYVPVQGLRNVCMYADIYVHMYLFKALSPYMYFFMYIYV